MQKNNFIILFCVILLNIYSRILHADYRISFPVTSKEYDLIHSELPLEEKKYFFFGSQVLNFQERLILSEKFPDFFKYKLIYKTQNFIFKEAGQFYLGDILQKGETRPYYNNSGLGGLIGILTPITLGRIDGQNSNENLLYTGVSESLIISNYAALTLETNLQLPNIAEPLENDPFSFSRLYLETGTDYFNFKIGKDRVIYGPGKFHNLSLSNNPESYYLSELIVQFPLPFPFFGLNRIDGILARLKDNNKIETPNLASWRLSSKILPFLEIGVGHYMMFGGKSAPKISLTELASEYFILTRKKNDIGDPGVGKSNHHGNADFSIFLPQLPELDWYGEIAFDDFLSPYTEMLKTIVAYTTGVFYKNIPGIPDTSIRLEAATIPARFYRHSLYKNGWSNGDKLLGDPMGPDAWALNLEISILPSHSTVNHQIGLNIGSTDSDQYKSQKVPDSPYKTVDRIYKDNPQEKRGSLNYKIIYYPDQKNQYSLDTAYEYVKQFNFTPGDTRHFGLISLNWTHSF